MRTRTRLSWQLLLAALLTGVAAGLAGVAFTWLLHAVQHLAFGHPEDTFLAGVEQASPGRRVLALTIGGALCGVGWWLLRRRASPHSVSVTGALAGSARLPLAASTADAGLQLLAVGTGASLGREGAPRQVGAALASVLADRFALDHQQRRVLLAAGAGAGLAAVYNVPLSGAAFALELLLGTVVPAALVPALLASAVATVVAWPFLGNHPTYSVTSPPFSLAVLVAAALLGPVLAVLGEAFHALTTWARTHAPAGWPVLVTIPVGFAALGALAIRYPQLLGNGKGMAQLALTGALSAALAAILALLKPVATAGCLRTGAIGGLLTPSFATGAALGLLAGYAWSLLWPGGSLTGYALLGAGALLATTQRAPITALLLTVEFTHAGPAMLPALLVAVAAAGYTGRQVRQFVDRRRDTQPGMVTP